MLLYCMAIYSNITGLASLVDADFMGVVIEHTKCKKIMLYCSAWGHYSVEILPSKFRVKDIHGQRVG